VVTPGSDKPVSAPVVGPSRRARLWEMTALALLTLVFGIVIGAGGTYLKYRDRITPRPDFDEGMLWRIVHEMQGRYELSEQQAQQVHTAIREQFEQMKKLRTSIEEQMEQIRAQLIVQMRGVLSTDQFRQWRQDLEEMQRRGGWRGRGPRDREGDRDRRPPGGQMPKADEMIRRATEPLNLSDEQKTAIEEIGKKYVEQFDQAESPEVRSGLFRKMWEEVNGVLTEPQRQKMQEQMQQMQQRFGPGRGGPRPRDEAAPPDRSPDGPPPPPNGAPPGDAGPKGHEPDGSPPPERPARVYPFKDHAPRVWA